MKKYLLVALAVMIAGSATAGTMMRSVLTKDNRQPQQGQLELSLRASYEELDYGSALSQDVERWWLNPALRFGVLDDLSAYVVVPSGIVDPEYADDEQGIGDVALGLEWKIFEDIFDYPWIMVHVEHLFDTGDEEKGLGLGESRTLVGVAVGTTMYEVLDLAVDLRYRSYDNSDDVASVAFSGIWELDEKLSLVAEAEVSEKKARFGDGHSNPSLFLGGFTYHVSDKLDIGFYGGTSKNRAESVIGAMRVALTF